MGLRFRKRIKILPGLWFNLSKSGVSTSIGGKGMTVNLSDNHTKTTVGVPGTGLSYSKTSANGSGTSLKRRPAANRVWLWFLLFLLLSLILAVLTG